LYSVRYNKLNIKSELAGGLSGLKILGLTAFFIAIPKTFLQLYSESEGLSKESNDGPDIEPFP
jgi:hypothetical protein